MRRHSVILALATSLSASAAPVKHVGDKPKPIDIKTLAERVKLELQKAA